MRARGLLLIFFIAVPARGEVTYEGLFAGTGRHGGSFYELGLTWGVGGLLHATGAAPMGLTGVRFVQHQGFLSQLIFLALGRLGVALGAVDIQVESEYETRTDANGRRYEVEVARTTTLTQRKSEGEVKAELDELDRGIDGVATWFECTVYAPKVLGFGPAPSSASGYELSFGASFELTRFNRLPVVLSLGGNGANVRSPVTWTNPTPDAASELAYWNLGLLGRVHFPLTRFADLALEWQPNVHTLVQTDDPMKAGVVAPSPLRLLGYLHLTNFLFVRGQVVLGGLGFTEGKLGYALEVGGRL